MLFRQLLDPETSTWSYLLGDEDSVQNATAAYGVGTWFFYNGDRERAREILDSIVAGSSWAAGQRRDDL